MRQRTMILILVFLIIILIVLWWLTLSRGPVTQPPVIISPTPTVSPTITPSPSPTSTPSPTVTPTITPTVTVTPTPTPTSTITFVPTPTPSPTGSIQPTAVPFPTAPSLTVSPTPSPTATSSPRPTTSPTATPTPEVSPPTISVTASPQATPASRVAELVVAPGLMSGSIKYQYRFKGQTQQFSFQDDHLIVAFPTSVPNRFRLVTSALEDSFEIIKIYDRDVISSQNVSVWSSPVFYEYIGFYNNKIILFGGTNDASAQDILTHDVQTGENKLVANDVGNILEINGNRITYEAFVDVPFNDENPDAPIPVGPEKTVTL